MPSSFITLTVLERTMRLPPLVLNPRWKVRLRTIVLFLAAALAACGGGESEQSDRAAKRAPAAAVEDQPRRTPHPGWYVGQTTQGLPARIQVFPGGRVDYLVRARLECGDGSTTSVRAVPNSPPVLRGDGSFSHRESGRGRNLLYRTHASGTVDRERAGGAFTGRALHRDGRECQVRLAWSAELLDRVGD
jgi:hypothetical protein